MRQRTPALLIFAVIGFMTFIALPAFSLMAPAAPLIHLRARAFSPQPGFPAGERALVNLQSTTAVAQRTHVLVQFERLPTPAEQATLSQAGLKLLAYVPDNAWFASIPITWLQLSTLPDGIRAIAAIRQTDKLSPRLTDYRDQQPLPALIATYPDVDVETISDLVRQFGGSVEKVVAERHYILANLPSVVTLTALSQMDSVFWIDAWPGPFRPKNDGGRNATKTNLVHQAGYHGNPASAPGSIVIGVWDCGWVESNHPGFSGRLTIGDPTSTSNGCSEPAGTNDHATHVAGTAAGSGTGSPEGRDLRGHADQATVLSYDVENAADEVIQAIQTYNLDISQNSWGPDPGACDITVLGVYDQTAADFDALVRGSFSNAVTKKIYVAFANGNEQSYCPDGWRTSSGGAMGKNVIAVGATNSDDKSMTNFSSFGPTEDGRINPTIVAPGCEANGEQAIWSTLPGQTYGGSEWCGTSMATPAVSGILGLMLEAYNLTYDADPLPSTLRAVLVQTAEDLGNPGPDYRFGYGHVDALAAINVITTTNSAAQSIYIRTASIENGQTQEYVISHPGGSLKCTLVWDDVPATLPASQTLINNLDLLLIGPDLTSYQPWILDKNNPANPATQGTNNIDTIEQIAITDAAAGTWTVRVSGSSIPQGPQEYSLVCPFSIVTSVHPHSTYIPVVSR